MLARADDPDHLLPVGRRVFSFVAMVALLHGSIGCTNSHRRGDDSPTTSEGADQRRPSDRVEPRRDPRFSGEDRPARRGIWVEQPQRSGFVSPTALANRVASKLPAVEKRCCGDRLAKCRGLEGRLLLELDSTGDGRVETAKIAESTLGRIPWAKCTLEAARNWQLPSPENGRPTTVYVPIRIRVPDAADSDATD